MARRVLGPPPAKDPWKDLPPYFPKVMGWRPDIDDEHYFRSHSYISSHKIMSWVKNPEGTKEAPIPAKALEMGTMLHALVLNPEDVAKEIIELRCTSLSKADREKAHMMAKAVLSNKAARNCLDPCEKEIAGYYTGYGMKLRIKCDALNTETKVIYDVKTTSDIRNFKSSIKQFLYGVQACFYLQTANLIEDSPGAYNRFVWIVVNKMDGKVQLVECPKKDLIEGQEYIKQYWDSVYPEQVTWPELFVSNKRRKK